MKLKLTFWKELRIENCLNCYFVWKIRIKFAAVILLLLTVLYIIYIRHISTSFWTQFLQTWATQVLYFYFNYYSLLVSPLESILVAQLLYNLFYTKVAADELDCPETEVASLAAGGVLSWWPLELGAGPPPARLATFLERPAYWPMKDPSSSKRSVF